METLRTTDRQFWRALGFRECVCRREPVQSADQRRLQTMGVDHSPCRYACYFPPPPLEAVEQGTIAKFTGTTNQSAITKDSAVTSERAHYFDAGVTQKIMEGWNVGLDAFYKSSHSTLDEGQFGQALIQSSFNYKRGRIYGCEFTTNYDHGPFSAYGNVGWEW